MALIPFPVACEAPVGGGEETLRPIGATALGGSGAAVRNVCREEGIHGGAAVGGGDIFEEAQAEINTARSEWSN